MAAKAMSVHEAEEIARKLAEKAGLELVEVELKKEPTGSYLRFYVDREDGISVDELETFHREVMPFVENVAYDFMEVSSPGVDRPLKTERDFERAEGMTVEVKTYKAINGAKQFIGDLVGLKDGMVTINAEGGEELSFAKKDVALVRPYIVFNEDDLRDDI